MKITYEIVRIEEDKIFIVPNISEKMITDSKTFCGQPIIKSTFINLFYDHVNKNWGCNLKIIFGFRKFSFSEGLEYEWKVVRSQKTGPFWGIDYFKKYEGEVPQESKITGFPSSSLFDL